MPVSIKNGDIRVRLAPATEVFGYILEEFKDGTWLSHGKFYPGPKINKAVNRLMQDGRGRRFANLMAQRACTKKHR